MHTIESIRAMLLTNDKAVARGVLAIFKNQTAAEQEAGMTAVDNGIGFNGADAFILSSFAKQLLEGWKLSHKQLEIARRKIIKYSRQLLVIAKMNGN